VKSSDKKYFDPDNTSARKHLLGQVMAHLPVHLYWKDRNGVYLGCNRQQAQSLGFKDPEDIIGKTDWDITKDKHAAEMFVRNDQEIMNSKTVKTIEENTVFNGKDSIVLSQKAPLFDESGNVVGIVGTSLDITELKHAQERERLLAVQAAEEKAQAEAEKELRQAVMILAGSIAHDLRTPISVVNLEGHSLQKSLTYLLKMYRDSGDDKFSDRQLTDLEKAGDDLRKIAMQMHDYIEVTLKTLSRGLKGGITQEDLVECSMWHCIHNTLTRYPFLESQKDLVTWDQDDFKFMGNELLTVRIFSNLLTNALQQIEKNKKGTIFITTQKTTAGNIIRFKDTAGGASPEITRHLFEGYKTTKEKGTGIGLAFCKMTLESFGGSIQASSVEGDYMEFLLNFPNHVA
jgi:PAS domain S-box-containing protein